MICCYWFQLYIVTRFYYIKKRKLQVFNFCNMCKNYLQSVNLKKNYKFIFTGHFILKYLQMQEVKDKITHTYVVQLCRISFIKDVHTRGHYSTLKRVLTHKHDGHHLFSNILKILRRRLKKSLKIYTTSFVSAK